MKLEWLLDKRYPAKAILSTATARDCKIVFVSSEKNDVVFLFRKVSFLDKICLLCSLASC